MGRHIASHATSSFLSESAYVHAGPGLMSMSAGDFAEVYRKAEYAGAFDCVATCFFIDTAHNVIDYLHVLYNVLKVWCMH